LFYALKQNEDGSVNVYDEAGEKVGTVPVEEAEAAAKKATTFVIEENGKNSRHADQNPAEAPCARNGHLREILKALVTKLLTKYTEK